MKRKFTKYPQGYVKADSEFTKRICVYFRGDLNIEYYLANAILDEALSKYGVQANFGYKDTKCSSYGSDVRLCIITSRKPIAKSKIKMVMKDELDLEVVDVQSHDFETAFF